DGWVFGGEVRTVDASSRTKTASACGSFHGMAGITLHAFQRSPAPSLCCRPASSSSTVRCARSTRSFSATSTRSRGAQRSRRRRRCSSRSTACMSVGAIYAAGRSPNRRQALEDALGEGRHIYAARRLYPARARCVVTGKSLKQRGGADRISWLRHENTFLPPAFRREAANK